MRAFRLLLLTTLLLAACGQPARTTSPTEPLPAGYRQFDGSALGFQLGLAPGWEQAGERADDGVSFTNGSRSAMMLVHFGRAVSKNLDAVAGAVMFDLTAGSGASGAAQSLSTLAGRQARVVQGSFPSAGKQQLIKAVIAIDSGLVWVLALAGPAESVTPVVSDFDRMRSTFKLLPRHPSPPAHAAVGEQAPDFPELRQIRGAVALNFFATWCGPCREEMPLLAERARSSRGRFTVLAVDTQDDASKVPGFMKELGLSLPLGYDRDGHLTQAYMLPGVPATFFLDSKHVIRQLVYGPLTPQSLAQGLKAAGAS